MHGIKNCEVVYSSNHEKKSVGLIVAGADPAILQLF